MLGVWLSAFGGCLSASRSFSKRRFNISVGQNVDVEEVQFFFALLAVPVILTIPQSTNDFDGLKPYIIVWLSIQTVLDMFVSGERLVSSHLSDSADGCRKSQFS